MCTVLLPICHEVSGSPPSHSPACSQHVLQKYLVQVTMDWPLRNWAKVHLSSLKLFLFILRNNCNEKSNIGSAKIIQFPLYNRNKTLY
jgi:hypothetical protein